MDRMTPPRVSKMYLLPRIHHLMVTLEKIESQMGSRLQKYQFYSQMNRETFDGSN
jgi:hypothetical protein